MTLNGHNGYGTQQPFDNPGTFGMIPACVPCVCVPYASGGQGNGLDWKSVCVCVCVCLCVCVCMHVRVRQAAHPV